MTDLRVPPLPAVLDPAAQRVTDLVATFRRYLHLPDPGALLIAVATVAANRGPGDPVWTLLVGPPGGGKTEQLAPLAGLPDVHPVATITEAALLSGTPKRDHDKQAKGGLLREIGDSGILLCKDFGSVLSMHREARAAVLAALREIYDGSWTRHLGSDGGRKLHWSGKVGLLAGCTPAIDSHHSVMGTMGERFVLYRLPPVEGDAQARRALQHVGREVAMRTELAEAVHRVLDLTAADRLTQPAGEADTDRLVSISTLAVRCRSAVERDSYSREVELIPEAEAPGRLALVLLRLRNALDAIGVDDLTAWALVEKAALDSMPALRRTVLECLVSAERLATKDVAERAGYPTTTARRALEDLAAHGVLHRCSQGQGKADLWAVNDWTRARWPGVPERSGANGGGQEPSGLPLYLSSKEEEDKSGTLPPLPGHVS